MTDWLFEEASAEEIQATTIAVLELVGYRLEGDPEGVRIVQRREASGRSPLCGDQAGVELSVQRTSGAAS
jgi:hypothetical protein